MNWRAVGNRLGATVGVKFGTNSIFLPDLNLSAEEDIL